jgi:hypothetical protein
VTDAEKIADALKVIAAFGPSSDRLPVTDAERIADALRACPAFINKDTTVRDWPAAPGGEYRLLRKGSSEWTCLPAIPGYSYDELGCFDHDIPALDAGQRCRSHAAD